jgi:hypothetical protein
MWLHPVSVYHLYIPWRSLNAHKRPFLTGIIMRGEGVGAKADENKKGSGFST